LFADFDALSKAFTGGYGLVLLHTTGHQKQQEKGQEEAELKEPQSLRTAGTPRGHLWPQNFSQMLHIIHSHRIYKEESECEATEVKVV
jgi:hypothetical protein